MFKPAFTFDDVALVPQYNNIKSRTEESITFSTWVTSKTEIKIPLLPANMDTVIGYSLAKIISDNGVYPIFHRFMSYEDKKQLMIDFGQSCYLSCGLKNEDLEELFKLYDEMKGDTFRGVCFDVAHGHCKTMIDTIKKFKDVLPDKEVIAGNVCTPMGYQDLVNAGADAVKVGIGPGAACTTRMVTGFGVPQFTAIYECGQVAKRLRVPLIADGGIRNSRDIVLALAAGASTVMIGKLFALTEESAAEKTDFRKDPRFSVVERLAKYRGQASKDFQEDFYKAMKPGTVAEGESFWAPVSGTAQELIDELLGGLRSGLTYGGARSIKELQRKAEFVEVTSNYNQESKPRKS